MRNSLKATVPVPIVILMRAESQSNWTKKVSGVRASYVAYANSVKASQLLVECMRNSPNAILPVPIVIPKRAESQSNWPKATHVPVNHKITHSSVRV